MESLIITETASADIRRRAASLALLATIGLTAIKLVVGKVSGSVSVLSEGIHSSLDLISAALAFYTIREAGKPADLEHPFGHGKIETLSALFESLLLVAAAGFIIHEGLEHLQDPQPVEHQGLAIGTILFSLVASYLVYRHNERAAGVTESSALKVNALHFLSDVVASAGVLVGLVVLKLTGWLMIDPIMAFAVAAYILFISFKQVKEAILELSDTQLPSEEVSEIRGILESFGPRILEAHDLRTRRSGASRHIDFHLILCGSMTVDESHAVCDEIEDKLIGRFPTASVNIHVEPCEHLTKGCRSTCKIHLLRKGSL